jgi:hypothetical protein
LARVLAVFLAVLAAGLVLGAQLTYSAAETAYRDSIVGRLRMIASQVAATIQESQSLGIALEAQNSLPALIGREAGGVPDLARIEILDPTGTVLFASAPDRSGEAAVIVPVFDDLGQQAGAVRIVRDLAGETSKLDALRRDLLARSLPIALTTIAAAGFVLAAASRRMTPAAPSNGAAYRRRR